MITEPSRRERKKEETRERIFKEAIRLFSKRGFAETTIDDITERADVAKGTFFNYFPRKESVLGYLSEQRLVDLEANAEAIFAAKKPAREKLIDVYLRAATAYEADRELSRYVINELMARAFDVADEGTHAVRWNTLVFRALQMARDAGELRTDVDEGRAAEMLTGIYYATIYTWVNCDECPAGSPYDFKLLPELRIRLELMLDGLMARNGAHR